jgi:riboflavin kinase / FMN adenylyltransferase
VLTCGSLEDLAGFGDSLHLALGVFDGVHVGHQAVISRAVRAAETHGGLSGLVTFHPHPCRAIRPDRAPPSLLATLDHKARIVAGLGVGLFVPVRFDEAFSIMSAGDFLDLLTRAPLKTIAVGEDWRFGRDREGDVMMLSKQAAARGYRLETVAPVMFEGERISSTRIRQAIRDGNLTAAADMLGRPYSICGEVLHGDALGRSLGFPTANVCTGDAQLPPDGVWAVRVDPGDGSVIEGVANLGARPTVGGEGRRLEVHLLDFSGDLYGKLLDVRFVEHLRGERMFPSLIALQQQIACDAVAARRVFGRL